MPSDERSRTLEFVNPQSDVRHITVDLDDLVTAGLAADQANLFAPHAKGGRKGCQRRLGGLTFDRAGRDLDHQRVAVDPAHLRP